MSRRTARRWAAVIGGCTAVFWAGAWAAAAAPAAYDCRFTEEPIAVDGRLDEPAWAAAAVIDGFAMPWLAEGRRTPARATRARLLWDRANLYLAAELDDRDLYADVTTHDGEPARAGDVEYLPSRGIVHCDIKVRQR